MQSNKIVLKRVEDNEVLLEPYYIKKKQMLLFGQPNKLFVSPNTQYMRKG